jgi:hypothetical protein
MNARRHRTISGIGTGLVLLGLGMVGGMAVDRIRFEPRRAALLAEVEAVIKANQGTPLAVGHIVRVPRPR